ISPTQKTSCRSSRSCCQSEVLSRPTTKLTGRRPTTLEDTTTVQPPLRLNGLILIMTSWNWGAAVLSCGAMPEGSQAGPCGTSAGCGINHFLFQETDDEVLSS